MKTDPITRRAVLGVLLLALVPAALAAQMAPAPYRVESLALATGEFDGPSRREAPEASVYRHVIEAPEAPWLQLRFGDWRLPEGSYLVLTAREDGAEQVLDAETLSLWNGRSAYFNGDAITLELFARSGVTGVSLEIPEIVVGERNRGIDLAKSICGLTDDRVASNEPAIGRIVPIGCTGWIVSNGAFLAAGHCFDDDPFVLGDEADILEFNVPASDADGTINHPPPADQYVIDRPGAVFTFGFEGNDWGVFDVFPNPATGTTAIAAQAAFFRMSRDTEPDDVRITGYGVDGPFPGYGNGVRNADNQTQQTEAGNYVGETVGNPNNVLVRYRADTKGGNSGGPVIDDDDRDLSIGIHTHGGCAVIAGANRGTSFEHDALEQAIQTFPGPDVVYVDQGHPVVFEDGTVLRPFDTVGESIPTVPLGGLLSIVTGVYDEAVTIDQPMTIVAPVGLVSIG